MSASASKKKRKELEEQGLSPRAVAEQKEKEHKAKTLKTAGIVALAVIVCLAAIFAVIKLVNRPDYDTKAAAVTVGDEKISVPVYDYFYNQTASNFYNSYSFLFQAGKKLSEQSIFGDDTTLEDYMKDQTKSTLQEVLNVCAEARKAEYKLGDEEKQALSDALKAAGDEAAAYGFTSTDKYLAARFGEGCTLDNYEEYLNIYLTFAGFATKLNNEFEPSAEELQALYDKDPGNYDIVNYSYVTSSAKSSPAEPETTEPATTEPETTEPATTEPASTEPAATVYTDEAKAEAKAQAESYLEEMPEDATENAQNKSSAATSTTDEIAEWLFAAERKEGDTKVFSKDEDGVSYYTVRFNSRDVNDYYLAQANIISIAKDKQDNSSKQTEDGETETTVSAEEKYEKLKDAVTEGMSDEDFEKAVTALEYTVNSSSPTRSYYIEEIRDFLYDNSRKNGDILTLERDDAYYLVRFVAFDKMTYRDTMIKHDLWDEFYEKIVSANEPVVDEELLKHAYTDLTFNASNSAS